MRKKSHVAILLVLAGFCLAAAANAELAITEIMSDSEHTGPDGDWWELTNTGPLDVDLTGYSWYDDRHNTHNRHIGEVVFGSITIAAGESIIILDEPSANTSAWKSAWGLGAEVNVYDVSYFTSGFPGLGGSDGVCLYDPSGILVTFVMYSDRQNRTSNEWDTEGTFFDLSVIGENGAYESTDPNPNVGSPCYAVTTGLTGTIYVDADASPGGNGANWATAYKHLQDALNIALNGNEILVAQGIYKPDQDESGNVTPGDRDATFVLISGVAVKGGYAGYGETYPNERNVDAYETILTGDLNGNDAVVLDPIDLSDEPTRAENSLHVTSRTNATRSALLDGFIITGGNANQLYGNAGGGMYSPDNWFSSPTLVNCTFSGNSAGIGGAMYGSRGLVIDCRFIGNSAYDGGAMYRFNGTLVNCTFTANRGYLGLGGGAIYTIQQSYPTAINCIFRDNSADAGGVVMCDHNSGISLINCTFSGNTANWSGGAVFNIADLDIIITNCTFYANTAGGEGGALWNAADGSAILSITNSIFWGNSDNGGTDESAQIYNYTAFEINHSCVQGWTGAFGGSGNHGDDPLFVDADGADNIAGTSDDNLRLMKRSSCIDHGDNTAITVEAETDLDGRLRIIDGDCNDSEIVDMGAYEFNFAYMGDFDNNCKVDSGDFAILALAWLTEAGDVQWNPACDIGVPGDSSINMPDLHVFVQNWLADNNP